MIQTYSTNKNMKVIIWATFWDNGRSNLYIMDWDFELKKYEYSTNSYLEVLDTEVAPIYSQLESGYKFM